MLRRTLLAGLMLAPMIFTACEDKDTSGPEGTNAAVTVNAYVDANGNGSLDAGDVGINNSSITLTGQDGTTYTATTNASGAATFDAVKPGSYTVSRTGTTPDGAVLATASSPVLVVPFQGGTLSSEFRYVFNPGSVSGQLFRDNNTNGAFDAGDTPAPGMTVLLFTGTDTLATPLATTTTDNNGVFTFKTLRPGNYTVKIAAIPTITIVGGTTQAVTVGANAATAVPVKFTGNLLSTVAEARNAAALSTVAFEGIVTNNQNAFATSATSSGTVYVQDATGGIQVFGLPATQGIVAGDSVRVIGTRTNFPLPAGEVEVTTSAAGQGVTKLGTKTVPAPKVLTVAQILSGAFQGQLVTAPNVTVTNVNETSPSTHAATISVKAGPLPGDTFQIRVSGPFGSGITPSTTFTVGKSYDVTGELGLNGSGATSVVQLKPRSPADIQVRSSSIAIDSARALRPKIDTVQVEGVVYVAPGNLNAASAYIMDKTGGIEIFNVPSTVTLVQGDSIRVRGLLDVFSNELEVARFSTSSPPVIEKLGTGTIPQPIALPATGIGEPDFAGSLIKLFGLTVTGKPTNFSTSTGSYNVPAVASNGTTLQIRVDNRATAIDTSFWQIGTRYDVAGVSVNFQSNSTSPIVPQIKPRNAADITVSSGAGPTKSIGDIRAAFAGQASTFAIDSATVDGVVTAGRGTFNSGSIYIYDGTGGIQVFNVPTTLTLVPGDLVRVHGKVVQFGTSHELEFTNAVPAGDTFSVTKLGTGPTVGPHDVTGAQLVARENEGQLVRLQNVTVTSMTTQATVGVTSYTVNGTAADGTAVVVFMSAPTGAVPAQAGLFTVGGHYDLTGIEVPFLTGGNIIGELKPRGAFDVVAR